MNIPRGRLKGARVLIKEIKKEDNKKGAIIVPNSDKEPTFRGTVLAVGDGALLENGKRIPVDISVGEIVHFTQFSGAPIVIDSVEYMVLNDRDVLFVEDVSN